MRLNGRHLPVAAALASIAMALPAAASSAPLPVEAVNEGTGFYGTHHWSNSQQSIQPGEKVTFRNPYTTTYHGLKFTGGPTTSCNGIPQMATEPIGAFHWEGECTFATPGLYTFICTVHPVEMTGAITVPGSPTATTEPPTGVTQTGATLNGLVEPEGNATEYHFEYGTTAVSEHTTSTLSAGSADFSNHHVSAELTGLLAPGVKYRFQLIAVYGASKMLVGGEQTFTTPVSTAPTVSTGQATGPTEDEATLSGSVDPNDGEATEYHFDYGPTSTYGQSTQPTSLPVDGVNHLVSATLSKLTPGTEYHFRLVAKNTLGPATGEDHTFKTASHPTPPAEPPSQPPSTTMPSTSTTPPPAPPTTLVETPPGPPIEGPPSLGASQHGSLLRGSLEVSRSGVGGRLEVDLLAKRALLSKTRRSGSVRVGRLVRASLSAGKVSFSVALTAAAKRALAHRHRLPLTVKITLTPPQGTTVSVTRSVTLHS